MAGRGVSPGIVLGSADRSCDTNFGETTLYINIAAAGCWQRWLQFCQCGPERFTEENPG